MGRKSIRPERVEGRASVNLLAEVPWLTHDGGSTGPLMYRVDSRHQPELTMGSIVEISFENRRLVDAGGGRFQTGPYDSVGDRHDDSRSLHPALPELVEGRRCLPSKG